MRISTFVVPRSARAANAAFVAITAGAATVAACVALVACPITPPNPKKACNTAVDCGVEDHCSHGFCETGRSGEGEGEGEGEGAVDDTSAVAAFCVAESTCFGGDVASCEQQEGQQLKQLRANPQPVCTTAADDFDTLLVCASHVPCSALQDQAQLQAACPIFSEAETLLGQCPTTGVGEGEGEGETQCPGFFALGPQTEFDVSVFGVSGVYDATTADACVQFGSSATVTIAAFNDLGGSSGAPGLTISGGQSSFAGEGPNPLANVSVNDDGQGDLTIQATACAFDQSQSQVAVQLFVSSTKDGSDAGPDGPVLETAPACGFMSFTGNGGGEGEGSGQ